MSKPDPDVFLVFTFLTEIGIISQLSSRLFEKHLPEGFLISHFTVLNHLVRLGDGRTPLSIAQALQVPKTTMTHTLSGLQKAGLITFEPNPKDSRSKCAMLTPAGRTFRDDAIATLVPIMATLGDTIDVTRIAETLPLLTDVRAYLDKERDG